MELLPKFTSYIQKENLFQKTDRLLIAVSGGADSSVLCELCFRCDFDFSIAHCNFQLRGEESDRDEIFVKKMSDKYAVEYFVKNFDTRSDASLHKTSVEETARNLRYRWFQEVLTASASDKNPFKYILTAHHADDNIETVMMNFFRGTGIKGLRGILPKHGNIVRPVLFARRKEILDFAAQNNIAFVTDSTNAENDYTRNYFRNELIPAAEKVYPGVSQNILSNAERFAGIEYLYNKSIDKIKKTLTEVSGPEVNIPVLKLAGTKPLKTVIYEIIKDYGFTSHQVKETEKLLQGVSGKYIVSATHRILRNRKWLIITPLNNVDRNVHHVINEMDSEVHFAEGKIKFMGVPLSAELNTNPDTAYADAALLKFPLLLRRWKQGDYFYPLGMTKKKKLSRFFSDLKLSLGDKEKIWVLESDKKIIWVVGYRIDDRFKITAKTTRIVKQDLIRSSQTHSDS